MKILMTGASGFIGKQLVKALEPLHQLTILSRDPQRSAIILGAKHHYLGSLDELKDLDNFDAIINLAGEPIAAKLWSGQKKLDICQSRWSITEQLTKLTDTSTTPPHTFISASAVGYYGNQGQVPVDESYQVSNANLAEFTHQVCHRWEDGALKASSAQTRVCIIRIGLVLGGTGGALAKMLPAFKLGLGGPIADGKQGMSWIHQSDLIQLFIHLLNNPDCSGIYNGCGPEPVSNKEFSQALGHALNRPAFIPMPAFVLRLILGEMSCLLIEGQYVMPKRTLDSGFVFQYPELKGALNQLLT
ncbi:TIGR01777 family oxidoreductase [Shewanella schlegeliana]|uniref:TIGR01777 family oxidoreductase n=1 Tax=Shewanella schlegeliana TaxID=190308 RepID=A0ABS1SX37_9GAMM|nr:TIGR01777 family oxidoreductase [Shewanella schlegeliana]MBL4913106.1 TIGR01777 family oxidoreductase [Shewanella schlegeliana]MCL1111120.1 TIGR01777 family oxidoreductase [Shewanella schlegeliana]GIU28222.1 epimerase [Shewanella schlegeliana]